MRKEKDGIYLWDIEELTQGVNFHEALREVSHLGSFVFASSYGCKGRCILTTRWIIVLLSISISHNVVKRRSNLKLLITIVISFSLCYIAGIRLMHLKTYSLWECQRCRISITPTLAEENSRTLWVACLLDGVNSPLVLDSRS